MGADDPSRTRLPGGLAVHFLRLVNSAVDYQAQFPAGYEDGHTAGLRLLRLAARVRGEHGRHQIGPLYDALGTRIFNTKPSEENPRNGSREFVTPVVAELQLDAGLVDALDDDSLDAELRRETDEALALTGKETSVPQSSTSSSRKA